MPTNKIVKVFTTVLKEKCMYIHIIMHVHYQMNQNNAHGGIPSAAVLRMYIIKKGILRHFRGIRIMPAEKYRRQRCASIQRIEIPQKKSPKALKG